MHVLGKVWMTEINKYFEKLSSYRLGDIEGSDNVADPKENEKLISKISEAHGDIKLELAWKLTLANTRLVPHTINRYFKGNKNRDLLISEGILDLFNACVRANSKFDNRTFIGYAIKYIRGYILINMRKNTGQVSIPKHSRPEEPEVFLNDRSNIRVKEALTDEQNYIDQDIISNKSNGEFCEIFLKTAMLYQKQNKKKHGGRGPDWYNSKSMEVLKSIAENKDIGNTSKTCKELKKFKQQISITKQKTFAYMAQYLRDVSPETRDEIFYILFGKQYNKYNLPFKGWRKRVWESVMTEEKGSYHTADKFVTPWEYKK